jgi:TonB family protein
MINRVLIAAALIAQAGCSTKAENPSAGTSLHMELPPCGNDPMIEKPCRIDHDVKPEISNVMDVVRVMQKEYPAHLRDRGIGGTTSLWLLIDPGGNLVRSIIRQGSGRMELDLASEKAVRAARFSPAKAQGKPVAVWIEMPVQFRTQ